jgi:ferredoxin
MVIHPDECIDCGVCEPECPVDAIKPDTEAGLEKWLGINVEYARVWPNITVKREPAPDAKEWQDKPDKPTCYRRTLAQVIEAGTSKPANGMARLCSAPRHGHPKALRGKTKIFYGHHPTPSFLSRWLCTWPNHALSPIASFCLDSLWVKSQN